MSDTTERIESMLTTVDNPWSPFDNYREWSIYDESKGYNSSALLARTLALSYELSDSHYSRDIERAIDDIISENVTGVFRKVSRKVKI